MRGARARGTGHFTTIASAEELAVRLNIVSPQLLRQAWSVYVGVGNFTVNAQPYGDEAWLKAAALTGQFFNLALQGREFPNRRVRPSGHAIFATLAQQLPLQGFPRLLNKLNVSPRDTQTSVCVT